MLFAVLISVRLPVCVRIAVCACVCVPQGRCHGRTGPSHEEAKPGAAGAVRARLSVCTNHGRLVNNNNNNIIPDQQLLVNNNNNNNNYRANYTQPTTAW